MLGWGMQLQPPTTRPLAFSRVAAAAAAGLLRRRSFHHAAIAVSASTDGRLLAVSCASLINSSSSSSSSRIRAAAITRVGMAERLAKRAKMQDGDPNNPVDSQQEQEAAEPAAAGGEQATSSPPEQGRRRRRPLSPPAAAAAAAAPKQEAEQSPPAPPAQAATAAANGAAAAPAEAAAAAAAKQHKQPPSPAQQQQQQEQEQQEKDQDKQQQQQQSIPAQANGNRPQQQQQQQQQARGQDQPGRAGRKEGKKGKRNWVPYLSTFHLCVKRELPYEAVHVYQKIKQSQDGKLDLAMCNGLLNVAVGNWQWELHQRHQHLLRQYSQQGQDTAGLQSAFDAYLAAQREKLMGPQQTDQEEEEVQAEPVDAGIPAGTPPALVCHIVRAAADKSCQPSELHSRVGLPDEHILDDMPGECKPFTSMLSDVLELVRADIEAAGAQPDEQLLMGLARVAGIMGDPDKALQYAKQVVTGTTGKAMTPRLRDFHPALVGYALAGQADKAGEVVHYMMAHCQPTDLTESEFALWLEAIAAGGTYEQLVEALQIIAGELNELKPTTLALVQRFFESDRGAAALAPGGPVEGIGGPASKWQVQEVVPDEQGHVAEAGATLSLTDLTEDAWQLFDDQLFDLGQKAENITGQFATFRRWLDQKGPFDITIDGANLAFYGENYLGGGFKCWKVKVAYERLQEQYPRAKILVVLHQSRHHQTKSDPDTFQWLEQLKQQGLLYITPHKMNDDMFWMYAPIRGRAASRLVSNDQMRDHVWSMLRPKHMLKWKARHIIKYDYNWDKTAFHPQEPKPYTPCVQQVRPGVWLLPSTQPDTWLLCQPQPA